MFKLRRGAACPIAKYVFNGRSSRKPSKCLEGTPTKRAHNDTADQSPVVEQTEGYLSLTPAPGGFMERGA